jgi:branched-chain amino acid transport system ATP-binding protein
VCDRVFVLDQGLVLASGTPAEIQRDPRVIDAYLGASR